MVLGVRRFGGLVGLRLVERLVEGSVGKFGYVGKAGFQRSLL